jgi:hypothetical protein
MYSIQQYVDCVATLLQSPREVPKSIFHSMSYTNRVTNMQQRGSGRHLKDHEAAAKEALP